MAENNLDRWQGKVDQKLDTICGRLGGISSWMEHHEKLDDERFGKLEIMLDHDKQQRQQIVALQETVLGNGREGLTTKVDRAARTLAAYNKLMWMLVGALVVGGVGAAIALL